MSNLNLMQMLKSYTFSESYSTGEYTPFNWKETYLYLKENSYKLFNGFHLNLFPLIES